jgi:hypothetical protein
VGIKIKIQNFEMAINDSLTVEQGQTLEMNFCGDGNYEASGCRRDNCGNC